MRIFVSGSSGLVGSKLVPFLQSNDHEVTRIVRSKAEPGQVTWDPALRKIDTNALENADAVVHLAGENIAEGRWTADKKRRIRESRVQGTQLLCQALATLNNKPKVLLAATAIGFYGDRGTQSCDETAGRGRGFLADVCHQWEDATRVAAEAGIRVVNLRIGVVLSTEGGALTKMLLPFKLGLGGRVGSGRQFWSWVSLSDLIAIHYHCLKHESLCGPVNAVAPQPVTNLEFTRTLGRVLKRPTVFPMPRFAARLALGEMANELLLASTRVECRRLHESGYKFQHPDLESCLRDLLAPK